MTPTPVRHAILYYTPELLASMCSGRFEIVANALPDDAKIIKCGYIEFRNLFYLVVESQSFRETAVGQQLPVLPGPQVTRLPAAGFREFF